MTMTIKTLHQTITLREGLLSPIVVLSGAFDPDELRVLLSAAERAYAALQPLTAGEIQTSVDLSLADGLLACA